MISTENKETIFTSEAFTYITGENSIYVECTVQVCLASDSTTPCSLCLEHSNRKRREVTMDDEQSTEQTTIIKSPIFYIVDKGTISFHLL